MHRDASIQKPMAASQNHAAITNEKYLPEEGVFVAIIQSLMGCLMAAPPEDNTDSPHVPLIPTRPRKGQAQTPGN